MRRTSPVRSPPPRGDAVLRATRRPLAGASRRSRVASVQEALVALHSPCLSASSPNPTLSRVKMSAMCGLLTYISAHGDAPVRRKAIADALESMHHRGPDDTGVDVVGMDAVFAHKRLAIIDVVSSHEPLPYLNSRYLLTFNGEIYNYLELRRDLAREFG